MRSFSMREYGTLEHLLAAKAAYYEKLSLQLADILVETGHFQKIDGEYFWKYSGGLVGVGIEV